MARRHADIRTVIWQDQDWRSLSIPAQWLYLALISQPDLNQLGVLALRPARWATLARIDRPAVDAALGELRAARFVVTDETAGELLVRTFVRNDEVWRKPNLMLAAQAQLDEVTSDPIKLALREEFERLRERVADLPDEAAGKPTPKAILERILERLPEPIPEPIPEPPTRIRGRGPTAHCPRSLAPCPTDSACGFVGHAQTGARLPGDWQPGPELIAWSKAECPQVDGRTETEKFRNHWHAKAGRDAAKLDWGLTWKNWILGARDRYGGARAPTTNGFDKDAAMRRAKEREAREAVNR